MYEGVAASRARRLPSVTLLRRGAAEENSELKKDVLLHVLFGWGCRKSAIARHCNVPALCHGIATRPAFLRGQLLRS